MAKYIDAERLKQILKPKEWGTPDERWIPEHEIGAMLDYFPAADVAEVVRCKDCKHADLFYPYCTIWEAAIDGDGYCYKGEKE